MNVVIKNKLDEISHLCTQYKVCKLELFGSAAKDETFDSNSSDLDFLVEFLPLNPGEHADHYFGLLFALKELFQREVDLVMIRAIKNRYFLESINRTRTVLYAA